MTGRTLLTGRDHLRMVGPFLDRTGDVRAVERFRLGMADLADAGHVPGIGARGVGIRLAGVLRKILYCGKPTARRRNLVFYHLAVPDPIGLAEFYIRAVYGVPRGDRVGCVRLDAVHSRRIGRVRDKNIIDPIVSAAQVAVHGDGHIITPRQLDTGRRYGTREQVNGRISGIAAHLVLQVGIMAIPAFNGPRLVFSGKDRTVVRLNGILAGQRARIMTGDAQSIIVGNGTRRIGCPRRDIRRAVMTRGAGHRYCRCVLSIMRRIDRKRVLYGTEHAEQYDQDCNHG